MNQRAALKAIRSTETADSESQAVNRHRMKDTHGQRPRFLLMDGEFYASEKESAAGVF
jgi:hypothetical protein